MSTESTPRMLGRYELLKRIAKGGMGEIYLARMRGAADFEKSCIIKTILPHLAEEEEFVTKFLDEGRIVVQLVHGNIVPVFDMGDESGEYYIAMEYIPGRDLREITKRLAQSGELMPVDLALYVASEVCKGLDYAHRKTDEQGESLGIVHRDVSPSNVLVSREGEVKLIDFGIARAAGRLGKTVSGRIQGKFCYMSPEQASGKKLDGRSDIFSTGAVLYELLTGFRPFEGDSDFESLDLVRTCDFDPPSMLNPEIPGAVDEIVGRALEKDPAERYQSIDRLQIEILQHLYSRAGSAPTSNDLEGFLRELFPEGLEREELRSARDSGPSPPKKMSLDEALDFEFRKLEDRGLPDDSVDPLQTTAISSAEIDEAPDSKTRTKPERPAARGQGEAESDESGAEEGEEAEPVTSVDGGARTPGRRAVGAVLILAVAAGGVAMWAEVEPEKGRVEIVSDPTGAQIAVDDALVPGAVTPHTLRLAEGDYKITLELDGFEDRSFRVSVAPGESATVSGKATKLTPVERPEGPRTFTITTVPPDAVLSVDGADLGTGEGAEYIVEPGEVVKVAARHPDCKTMMKQISHAQERSDVELRLRCPPASTTDAGEAASGPQKEPREVEREKPTWRRVRITSDPPGAMIAVNGERLGPAPVVWRGPRDSVLNVTASKDGHTTVEQEQRASAIERGRLEMILSKIRTGCIHATVTNPFVAEFWVDGEKITRGVGYLKHDVPAGKHTVRIVNEANDLDVSRSVDVEPGDECALVSIDGRKL